ncbi:MAG TPA: SprB repeat-containing protein, partial [Bacteroidales bacterium]|nr:SprB repeat-containing protein [Bacteroidales bacterium]
PATCERAKNGFVSVAVNSPNPIKEINWKDHNGNIVGHGYALSQIPAGQYIVEVVDTSANIGQLTINVANNMNVAINSIVSSPVSCHGGNDGRAMVKANGGSGRYSYLWNNGDSTDRLLNLTKGIYQVRVTDMEDSSCYATASITISEPDPLQILLSSYKKPTCYGGHDGELSVKAIGGNGSYKYEWEDSVSGNLHKGLSPGSYRVTVIDAKECKSETSFTLPDTIPIEIDTLSLTMPLCYGSSDGSIKLSLKGAGSSYMVRWPDLGNIVGTYVTQLKAGKYRIEARNNNDCVFRDTIVLGQPAKLVVDSITYNQPSCSYASNGSIRVFPSGGTSPYRFKINN